MKVAVFGATGMIGSRIVRELLDRGHEVTAVARDPARAPLPEHARLSVVAGDVTDEARVRELVSGRDAVVSAVAGPVVEAAHALLRALPAAGVRRLAVVGGAGSLEVEPGLLLLDAPWFPAEWRGGSLAGKEALDVYRASDAPVDWTFVSPSHEIDPGERTGRYRIGGDELLRNAEGRSWISAEDYALGFVDVLEGRDYFGQRITLAD